MLAREPASLWREHVVAVVNLVPRSHSVLAVGDLGTRLSSRGGNKLSNVRSFIILRSGEALTSYNKDNNVNFSSEKRCNEAFWGVYCLTIRKKT